MLRLTRFSILSRFPKSCSPYSSPAIHPRRALIQHNGPVSSPFRSFSSTPLLLKKKERGKSSSTEPGVNSSAPDLKSTDSLDLSQLQQGIATAVARLKDELSKLRMGGRLGTDALESLRVQISKGSKETVKLGDLAQVFPKSGRLVAIMVSEEEVSS